MYIAAIQDVLQSTTKIIVDQKGSGNLMLLPLDKLLQMPPSGSTGSARQEPVPDVASPQVRRSREAFRSRDREPR